MKVLGVRRWGTARLRVIVAVGLVSVGWWVGRARRHRANLAELQVLMGSGRHAAAARELAELLTRQPGSHESFCLLGLC